MAKKQFYCIDFRNMHNGFHGLFVFDNRKDAEDNFIYLKNGITELEVNRGAGKISEQSANNKYHEFINEVYLNSSSYYEEIDYKQKQEKTLRNKLEEYYEMNGFRYIVVNFRNVLDLYV